MLVSRRRELMAACTAAHARVVVVVVLIFGVRERRLKAPLTAEAEKSGVRRKGEGSE